MQVSTEAPATSWATLARSPATLPALTINPANGKTTYSGQTVWTCAKVPDEGWQFRKWTVAPVDERTVKLEPSGRMESVIFMDPTEVYATAEDARDAMIKRLEGESEHARDLSG